MSGLRVETDLVDANGAMTPTVERISLSVLPFHAAVMRHVDPFQSAS